MKTMMTVRTLALGLVFIALSETVAAAVPADLPSGGFAPGWQASDKPRLFIEQDLFNHIDGGAELFLEFGFAKLQVQSYVKENAELVAELYEMKTPVGALGIYLMNAGRETPWTDVPARNSSEEAQIIALKGRFLLKIVNFDPGAALRPAMAALAGAALAAIPDEPLDDPFVRLPSAGRVPGSDRLIGGPVGLQPYYTFGEGDILDLAGTAPAVLAEYASGDGPTFLRLIVDYPDAEKAAAVLKYLRANLDPYLKVAADRETGFDFSDYQDKYGRVERRSARLEILFKLAALQ